MKQKEIWLCLDSRSFGGIETHVFQLATLIQRARNEVKVIFLEDYGTHPLKDKLDNAGIQWKIAGKGFLNFARLIQQGRPDVLHSHGYKAGLYSRLIGRFLSIKTIHTHHAGERLKGRLAFYSFIDRYTAFLHNTNLTVSTAIQKSLPCRAYQVNNFILPPEQMDVSSGKQIAFVGRLSHEKGPDTFIELASHFPSNGFHVYGTGPEITNLVCKATPNVVFHGHCEMEKYWHEIGVLVICSRHEGLPMVALEAMARGIVVLAYQVGELGNLIANSVNGETVPAGAFQQLLAKLHRALNTPPQALERLQQNAVRTISNAYSLNALVGVYSKLYQFTSPHQSLTEGKKTVLLVHYGDDWIRGSEVCLIELCARLQSTHWRPVVWCNSSVLAERLKAMNITVAVSHFSILLGWEKPRLNLFNYRKLRTRAEELLLQYGVDLVHCNNGAPNQWMIPIAKRTGVPVLCQLHSSYLLRDRLSLFLNEADVLVGVSKAVLKPFAQFCETSNRCVVIENGITQIQHEPQNLKAKLGIDAETPLILSVGSLIRRKGFDLLLQAIASIASDESLIKPHLAIIGDGEEANVLKHLARSLNICEQIHWLGEQENASIWMGAGVDLFVSAARDEAFGLVIAEAGAAGLPVVATRVGGVPEVLDNGRCGLLVETESAADLAQGIRRLINNPGLAKAYANKLHQRVKTYYSADRNSQRIVNQYESLLRDTCHKDFNESFLWQKTMTLIVKAFIQRWRCRDVKA